MKKLFTTLNSLLVAAAMLLSGCSYDDSGLLSELDKVKGDVSDLQTDLGELADRVAALEASLASEVEALKAMVEALDAELDEKVVVSGYEKAENGDVTVTLSDGKKFTAYAEPEHTAVTVYTENDVQYWATVDANDAVVPVRDADGNLVPVVPVKEEKEEAVLPQFAKSEDGSKVVVSFDGGLTWVETGAPTTEALEKVSIFSGVEIVTSFDIMVGMDVATAAKITLADGSTLTLDLDAAFVDFYGMQYLAGPQFAFATYDGQAVTSQYIPYGVAAEVPIKSSCVVDVMVDGPKGWEVSVFDDREEGDAEPFWACKVTAPSKEAVAAGNAVALGTVKAFAVLNNGKVLTSSFTVTAEAIKSASVSGGVANIEMYSQNGFVYGLCPVSQFDEMMQMNILMYASYLNMYTWQEMQGMGVNIGAAYMEYATSLSKPLTEILTTELDACAYMLWVLPLDDTGSLGENAEFNTLVEVAYSNATLNSVALSDANVTVVADSSTPKFYAALFLATESNMVGYVESSLNYSYCEDDKRNDSVFTGNVSELKLFNKATLKPGTAYKLCVVPYNAAKETVEDGENRGSYTIDDCVILDFTTSLPSEFDEAVGAYTLSNEKLGVSKVSCTIQLPSTAAVGYYKWADAATMASLITDADKAAYILTGNSTTPSKYNPTPSSYPSQTCEAGSTWTLLAATFGADWKIGNILVKEFTAKTVQFNDLTVAINKVTLGEFVKSDYTEGYDENKGFTVEASVSGGTAVAYRVAAITNNIFTNTYKGNAENAVTALMDDPNSTTYFKKADALPYNYDASLSRRNGPYHIIVVAVTGEGDNVVFSKPAHVQVEVGGNGYVAQ